MEKSIVEITLVVLSIFLLVAAVVLVLLFSQVKKLLVGLQGTVAEATTVLRSVDGTLQQVEKITQGIDGRLPEIDRLITSVDALLTSVRFTMSLIQKQIGPPLIGAASTVTGVRSALNGLKKKFQKEEA